MYKDNSQLRIEDFVFPYGKLDLENDWGRLATPVPWDVAEERCAAQFVNNGHPAPPVRMALGALLIQRRLILFLDKILYVVIPLVQPEKVPE